MAKQPYYRKRLDIFEQYYQREQEKIEKAKADNKEIKVLGPLRPPASGQPAPLPDAPGAHPLLCCLQLVTPLHGVCTTAACAGQPLAPLTACPRNCRG